MHAVLGLDDEPSNEEMGQEASQRMLDGRSHGPPRIEHSVGSHLPQVSVRNFSPCGLVPSVLAAFYRIGEFFCARESANHLVLGSTKLLFVRLTRIA